LWAEGRATALQRQTRHLSDIYALLGGKSIPAFVGSAQYQALIVEVDEFGRAYFPRDHRTPEGLRFAGSSALSPGGGLRAAIEEEYVGSRFLFYGDFPDLGVIYRRIEEFRDRL
jgi:hypothetical protein